MSPTYTERYDGSRFDYGAKYGQTLTVTFTFIKEDYTELTLQEQRDVLRWLGGYKQNSWMTLYDNNYSPICELFGRFINIQAKSAGASVLGYIGEFECTSNCCYSYIREVEQTVDAEQTFILNNDTDFLDTYVYPVITIEPQGADISELHILNEETKEESILKNIKADETIVIDSGNKIVTSNHQYKHLGSGFSGKRVYSDAEIEKLRTKVHEAEVAWKTAEIELTTVQIEATALGVDLNRTQYGNIDLNNRAVLVWNDSNLAKYEEVLKSYQLTKYEMSGTHSTVLGMWDEFNGVQIAFSPLLQTKDGPLMLTAELVRKYIERLMEQTTSDNLITLDAQGLEINNKEIKGIIADVGETAPHTSKIMHFAGPNGAIADAQNEVTTCLNAYNSLKTLTDSVFANPSILAYTSATPIWPRFAPGMNHIVVTTDAKVKITFKYRYPMKIGTVIKGVI